MSAGKTRSEEIEKLFVMIFEIHHAMLVTNTPQGSLRSRPMGVHLCRNDDCLWLFTDRESAKVLEIRNDREVNISFSSPERMKFVSVTGVATTTDSRQKIDEVWAPISKVSHPEGKNDPDLILIRVVPTFAEYWDESNQEFSRLYQSTKAMLTGEIPERVGEHAELPSLDDSLDIPESGQ